jgi:mannosyl-glycoprotein endo-beta-N-acetylglucosaminidase
MVVIPPVGWINAGHANGALVLGTFILEWAEGAAVAKVLFADRQRTSLAAKQLARISRWYGFDGWLVRSLEPPATSLLFHHPQGLSRAALR